MEFQKKIENLMIQFGRTMHKVQKLEKKPRDYGTGDLLYSSEIHTISFIGQCEGINITTLAKKFDVTKGAVSQIINKLRKKGFVEKFRYYDNDKEVLLKLTDKGKKANSGHMEFHRKFTSNFFDFLNNLKDDEINLLMTFLKQVERTCEKHWE